MIYLYPNYYLINTLIIIFGYIKSQLLYRVFSDSVNNQARPLLCDNALCSAGFFSIGHLMVGCYVYFSTYILYSSYSR